MVPDNIAQAQRSSTTCNQVNSTAAALECVNKKYQNAQNEMSAIFKALNESQNTKTQPLLTEAQKQWILYRDSQCQWETALSEIPALDRLSELSCLSALTDNRIATLTAIKRREESDQPREFGALPRWMNALASDYPKIFWRYGEEKTMDLDCNGHDEQIMAGVSIERIQNSKQADRASHDLHIVIAISENPQAGRPKASLIKIPVHEKAGEAPHLCRPSVRLEKISRINPETETETAAEEFFCATSLRVTDRDCIPLEIFWDGKNYVLRTELIKGTSH